MLACFAALALAQDAEDSDLTGCTVQLNGNFFNLGELMSEDSDYMVSYLRPALPGSQNDTEVVTIAFNFCTETSRSCDNEESNEADFANIAVGQQSFTADEVTDCSHVSSASLSDVDVSLISWDEPRIGLSLALYGGDLCNATTSYEVDINLICDYSAQTPVYELVQTRLTTREQDCDPKVINFRSIEGCPKISIGSLWRFYNNFYVVFALLMIGLGLFFILFGGEYKEVTLFLIGGSIVTTFMLLVLYIGVIPDNQGQGLVAVALISSLAVGAAAGYATQRWGHIGVLLVGIWLGALIGSVIYSCLIRLITEEEPTLFLCLSALAFAALVGYLSQVYFHLAVIVGSAIIGSFLVIRVSAS